MDTSEVIAVIRDISVIILIGLWLIAMVAVGVIGVRIYRSVKRIAGRVKESYQTIRNGLVGSLLIPILPDGAMHWTACPEFIQGCHHTRRSQIELV